MKEHRQCTAKNRAGERCKRAPIRGGTVCRLHGGAAPQVIRSAQERINAMVHPALVQLARLIDEADSDGVKLSAIKDVLDRAGYKARDQVDVKGDVAMRVTVTFDDPRSSAD